MIEKIKQNLALTIGLAIPVGVVLLIAGMVYLPRMFATPPVPQYDFVYAVGANIVYPSGVLYMPSYPAFETCFSYTYVVENGKLIKKSSSPDYVKQCGGTTTPVEASFFRHDTVLNKSIEVTFDEVSQLQLHVGAKSPDGFEIVHGRRADFFPIFGGGYDYSTQFLKKGTYTQKLEVQTRGDVSYYSIDRNLGWVPRSGDQ